MKYEIIGLVVVVPLLLSAYATTTVLAYQLGTGDIERYVKSNPKSMIMGLPYVLVFEGPKGVVISYMYEHLDGWTIVQDVAAKYGLHVVQVDKTDGVLGPGTGTTVVLKP